MAVALILVLVALGSVIFHLVSPWWWTPIASNWQYIDNTIIITHHLWIEAFNRDPAVIGRALTVDGEPYTVRGVLREGFQFPRSDASYGTRRGST